MVFFCDLKNDKITVQMTVIPAGLPAIFSDMANTDICHNVCSVLYVGVEICINMQHNLWPQGSIC